MVITCFILLNQGIFLTDLLQFKSDNNIIYGPPYCDKMQVNEILQVI